MRIDQPLLEAMADVALAAGVAVMRHFGKSDATLKSDGSPVTLADAEAEALILPALAKLLPGIPVIAEEAASAGTIPDTDDTFILVDPLDGTKEFISGNKDFTVNIAVVFKGRPIAGVIHAPALNRLWFGATQAEVCDAAPGSTLAKATNRKKIAVRMPPKSGLAAVASKSHSNPETEAYLDRFLIAERRSAGSSLKFCLVAEGVADLYPRLAPTMEWDTAAGHAILLAAGGAVDQEAGGPLLYGKKATGYRNPGFIAVSNFAALEALTRKA